MLWSGLVLMAVNAAYVSETPAALFVLCNVVEDGQFRGVIYSLSRK